AAKEHVEGGRHPTTRLIAELKAGDSAALAGPPPVFITDQLREGAVEAQLGDRDVAMLVAGNALEIAVGKVLGEPFGHNHDAEQLPFLLAELHRVDDMADDSPDIHDRAGPPLAG